MPPFSSIYSIPYVLVMLILIFLFLNETRVVRLFTPKASQKIALVILILFWGLRGHLGTDFISYQPFFNKLPNIWNISDFIREGNSFTEIGFVVYSSLIKTVFPNYFVWVFINTVIDFVILQSVFRRYSTSAILSFILFFSFYGSGIEINLFRNSKALMLFLLSLPYLQERRIMPYMLLNILGCTFHLSSIVYLPLYFILTQPISRRTAWILFAIANVVFFAGVSFKDQLHSVVTLVDSFLQLGMEDKAYAYLESKSMEGAYGFTLGYFERTGFFILFTLCSRKMLEKFPECRMLYNSFVIFYFLYHVLAPISTVVMSRITNLFVYTYWLLIPIAIYQLKYKRIFIIGILFLCLIRTYMDNRVSWMYYENVLINYTDNYNERRTNAFRLLRMM